MTAENKNKLYFYISYAIRTTALLCASGSLIQTFLAMLGFSTEQLYIHTTVLQAANVLTTLLCSGFADRGSLIRRVTVLQIPSAILYFICIPFCIASDTSVTTYVLLVIIAALQAVFTGLNSICEYKLPYAIFSPESYSTVLAVSGIMSTLLSLGVGALVSALSTMFPYSTLMLFAFVIAGVCLLISAVLHSLMKPLITSVTEKTEKEPKSSVPLLTVFRHPAFLHLIPANLLRGFAYGTTMVMTAIAISLGFDEGVATMMVSVQSAAGLVGCTVFGLLAKKMHPRFAIGFGTLFFLLFPLLLTENATVFLVVSSLIFFGRFIIDHAVPAALRYSVPAEIAGPYNAWRMILHNVGILIATTVAVWLPLPALLILTLITQALSGLCFVFLPIMKTKTVKGVQHEAL